MSRWYIEPKGLSVNPPDDDSGPLSVREKERLCSELGDFVEQQLNGICPDEEAGEIAAIMRSSFRAEISGIGYPPEPMRDEDYES